MQDSMSAPVQNPHIMFRSDPLPEEMRSKLRSLDYAPHVTDLLMQGLPIVYHRDGQQIVEYPDGHRISVKKREMYDENGKFIRFHYDIIGNLPAAER